MGEERKAKFQFQSSRRADGADDFPSAVAITLKRFQDQSEHNVRRQQGTAIFSVTNPEDNAYFAIVMAGPFTSLEAMTTVVVDMIQKDAMAQMKRLGIGADNNNHSNQRKDGKHDD